MIAIIDYGVSNIDEIASAVKSLNSDYLITNNEYEILKSNKVILPGDSDVNSAVKQLHKNNLFTMLRVCRKPILGINTGMQVFADHFKEMKIGGLGIFPGTIQKFDSEISEIPFKGFYSIEIKLKSKLFNGIESGDKFYFNHTSYLPINIYTSSVTDNNTPFSSSIETENYYGVQFNPEKSGETGLKFLKNFIEM